MTTLSRFEIHQPASVLEASQMLAHYGDEAGIYAGGTELLLAMKHSALNYRHLIDLKVVPGLNSIEVRNGSLEIGATATHRGIERSAAVQQHLPVLAEMESRVANVRVRATGTLGGNLCFAEPHSDPATLLLVLGGAVKGNSIYGTFPTLALGRPNDADQNGRWIPTTALDQYAATLATWFGVSAANLPSIFPNLVNFSTGNLGFLG
jgi:CO/xanthine dehydrogenase FAD-binding subunit